MTAVEQLAGTVKLRLGSASQVSDPLLSTRMYLYEMTVPGAKLIVPVQTGLLTVYPDADKATALAGAQLPSAELSPTILTVWPTTVVFSSLNVTWTDVAAVQELVVVGVATAVVLGDPGMCQ